MGKTHYVNTERKKAAVAVLVSEATSKKNGTALSKEGNLFHKDKRLNSPRYQVFILCLYEHDFKIYKVIYRIERESRQFYN